MLNSLQDARRALPEGSGSSIDSAKLDAVRGVATSVKTGNAPKESQGVRRYKALGNHLERLTERLEELNPGKVEAIKKVVIDHLPYFVYYSNYGNLDSEIYLPHVIDNLRRNDLGRKEEAKVRTLKVLFEFVGLKPEEILDLGQDAEKRAQPNGRIREPTQEEIEEVAARKKEREVLLTSASSSLTGKFRDWWKQGEYRFRFNADGNHFRIWVSDDRRPEEIELEGRSAGLQWFLSFYLVFLVESRDSHAGAILLLDEPGQSLHPLAKEDLSAFFDGLADTNQILYTTHSPFLVDPDHLDRVKAVFVDKEGYSAVSSDLRAGEKRGKSETDSVYAVHAALGLSAAKTWFRGGHIVVVEGDSDQIYLSAIKNYLIGHGLLRPARDLLFMPARGVKGVRTLASVFSSPDEPPPPIILDADGAGRGLANSLRSGEGKYAIYKDRVILLDQFTDLENAEIEDLWPTDALARVVSRYLRGPAEDFDEVYQNGEAIVPQVKRYAEKNELELEKGWKVEVAMLAKSKLLRKLESVPPDSGIAERWLKLFETLMDQLS